MIKKRFVNGTAYPHAIELNHDSEYYNSYILEEMVDWCEKTFGELNSHDIYSVSGKWLLTGFTIRFKSEADYNWFLLRWSSENV